MESVRFYFSFRSPYSWLACHRLTLVGGTLPIAFDYTPVFPRGDGPESAEGASPKGAYVKEDVERIAAAYGLTLHWPQPFDVDWVRPHAAFLWAKDQDGGPAFAAVMSESRFAHGLDLVAEGVIASAAERCSLDPEGAVAAAADPALHKRVLAGMGQARDDGVFGVPFFVCEGRHYWGNDRLEWLLRDIRQRLGKPLPDLEADPLARPF